MRSDLEAILKRCFTGTDLVWEITDDHVVIRHKEGQQAKSDQVTIEGRVLDEYRKSLAGVSVVVKGHALRNHDRCEGRVQDRRARQKDMVVRFSFIGMTPQEISYVEGETVCEPSAVIDRHRQRRGGPHGLSGADAPRNGGFDRFDQGENIYNPGLSTIDQMLEGRSSGPDSMQSSGQLGAAPKLRIRGTTTVLGSQEPLWVIDGVVQSDPVNIDPEQINDLDFVNLLGNAPCRA